MCGRSAPQIGSSDFSEKAQIAFKEQLNCKTNLPIDSRCTQGMKAWFSTSCKTYLHTFRIKPQIALRFKLNLQNIFAQLTSDANNDKSEILNKLPNALANF